MSRKKYLTPEDMLEIVEKIAEGSMISTLCVAYNISPYYLFKNFEDNSHFNQKLKTARLISADLMTEELLSLTSHAETATDVAAARVKSENIRWLASKHAREIYGEKMDVAITNTLDLSKVLAAANARVVPMLDQQPQQIDVSPMKLDQNTTGLEPAASKKGSFDDLL